MSPIENELIENIRNLAFYEISTYQILIIFQIQDKHDHLHRSISQLAPPLIPPIFSYSPTLEHLHTQVKSPTGDKQVALLATP